MTRIPQDNLSVQHQIHSFSAVYDEETEETQNYIYQPTFWISQFPNFTFAKLFIETENSMVWTGTRKDSPELLALKISSIFQSQSSQKQHQNNQNLFVSCYKFKGMAEIKQVHHAQNYRLMVMHFYQYNLQQVFKRLINNHIRYTKDHIQFVAYVFKNILHIVQELHDSGHIHRDLKPENFLVDQSFNIVLSDFELVCKELEVDTSFCGTVLYMAPERLSKIRRSSYITRQNDIWALGIILFQLFTGQTPYSGQSQDQIFQQICSGHIRNKQIPNQAMNLIIGILNTNTSKRLKIEEIKLHPFLQQELKKQDLKLMQGNKN